MMRNFITFTLILSLFYLVSLTSCKKDEEEVPDPIPSEFICLDSSNTNYPIFVCTSDTSLGAIYSYTWDFGNKTYSNDDSAKAYYPFPGTYTVLLYITSAGGTSVSKAYYYGCDTIDSDLTNDPYLRNLTFSSNSFTKQWMLSTRQGHISTGSSLALLTSSQVNYLTDPIVEDSLYPENYLKTSAGDYAYNDSMAFTLQDYKYISHGSPSWVVNWVFANNEFGYNQAEGQDICIDISNSLDTAGTFKLDFTEDSALFMELPNKNFMLYYEGKQSKIRYQVLCLREDLMVVRKPYFDIEGKPMGYRMLRYVPKGNQDKPLPVDGSGNLIVGSILKPPTK